MSRSYRKTPIIGNTTCRSEREGKKLWHKSWRIRERAVLAGVTVDTLNVYTPLQKNQVSSLWNLGKDGHQYWPVASQQDVAERIASRQGRSPQECAVLKKRLLRKWMAK